MAKITVPVPKNNLVKILRSLIIEDLVADVVVGDNSILIVFNAGGNPEKQVLELTVPPEKEDAEPLAKVLEIPVRSAELSHQLNESLTREIISHGKTLERKDDVGEDEYDNLMNR